MYPTKTKGSKKESKKMCGPQSVDVAKQIAWFYIFIFTIASILFLCYIPTASDYRYTYQLSASVGTLSSQRWSFDFIVTASLMFVFLVPLTLAYYMSDMKDTSRWKAHVVIVAILSVWFFATFIYQAVNLASRNRTDAANLDNPFNDPRWCLVNANIPGAICYISSPTGVFQLSVNTPPVVQFSYQLAVFIVLLLIDLPLVLVVLRGAMAAEELPSAEALIGASACAKTYKGKRRK